MAGLLLGVLAGLNPGQSDAATQVRAGIHDGFGRLAFEWATPIEHDIDRRERTVVLRFSQPVDASLTAIRSTLGAYIAGTSLGEGGRRVVLRLAGDFEVKTAVYEDRIVAVDILGRPVAETAAAKEQGKSEGAAARRPPPAAIRFGTHEGFERIVIDWPAATTYDVQVAAGRATVRFDGKVRLDLDGLPREGGRYFRRARTDAEGNAPLVLDLAQGVRVRHFRTGTKLVLDLVPVAAEPDAGPSGKGAHDLFGAAPEPGAEAGRMAAEIGPAAGVADVAAEPSVASDSAASGKAELHRSAQGVSLRFTWPQPVGAAVFERAGFIWAVFDTAEALDIAAIPVAPRTMISDLRLVDAPGARAVRIASLPGFHPVVRRQGSRWIIDFVQRSNASGGALQARAEMEAGAVRRWLIPVLMPTRRITFIDPEVGDRLQVVALPGEGQGLKESHETAFFRLLPTAQGIAMETRHDAIVLRSTRDGVEVVDQRNRPVQTATPQWAARPVEAHPTDATRAPLAPHEAIAAAGDDRADAGDGARPGAAVTNPTPSATTAEEAVGRPLFDLAAWGRWDKSYDEARLERLDALIDAPEKDRNQARLDLARFFFARARAPEALGLLEIVAGNDEELARRTGFRAMQGALHILAGRFDEAAADLIDPALREYGDGVVWLAALAAEKGDTAAAARGFSTAHATVAAYPEVIRRRLAQAAVAALTSEKLDEAAESYAAMLEALADSPERRAEVSYARGRIALAMGETDEAKRLLEIAAKGPDRRSRVEAAYHLVELALKEGAIDAKEAAARLEKLRFGWRGGPFEIQVLKRLGQTYLTAGDWRRGLEALRYAAMLLDAEQDKEIKGIMQQAFEGLFLGENAGRVDPLTAIGIFEMHKDLVPAGERGDRILRGLVDRLIDVDLLDRARELLVTLVEKRLQGEAKAEAGYRLALVEMLDRNPGAALKSLAASEGPRLPPAMIRDRRFLAAEALAAQGHDKEALAALLDDRSAESERLRAEIHARAGRWAEAAGIYETLLGAAGMNGSLSPRALRDVLDWGIALAMQGDNAGLARLGERFAQAVGQGPEAAAFALLTSSPGTNRSYESIAAQLRAAKRFESHYDDYRRRLRSPNGATN